MKAGISCTSFILCKLSRSFRKTEITNIENREIKLFCCGGCLVTKSCLTLCDPMDCSLPGSSVHGISQARILEFVAISYSRGHSQLRNQTHVSHKSIALQADSLPPSHQALLYIHKFIHKSSYKSLSAEKVQKLCTRKNQAS